MNRGNVLVITALIGLSWALTGHASDIPQTPTPTPDFLEGAGRNLVVRICSDCHAASTVTTRHESRTRWSAIVDQMADKGAEIKDEEFDAVVSYLSVAFGKKIKINESNATAIADTLGIDETLAVAIVKYRADNGPFKEWKDLTKVKGVDPKRVEEQKNNLDFGG